MPSEKTPDRECHFTPPDAVASGAIYGWLDFAPR